MSHPPPTLADREVTYVIWGCFIIALCVVGVAVLLGGCSQPSASPTRISPPSCSVMPAVVSDTFCIESYAGASRCVACFKTPAFFDRDPVYGCILPNNNYCIDESGCSDQRCKKPYEGRLSKDAGANDARFGF